MLVDYKKLTLKNKFIIKVVMICCLQMIATFCLAQCAICTKTASQLGEGPAKSLNAAIIYLMFIPLLIMVTIGYKWWKNQKLS